MLYVFLSIFVGVAVGLALQGRARIRRRIINAMQPLVLLLLLILGMNLGSERSLWSHFATFGWSATVLAIGSVAGSIMVSSLYYLVPRRKQQE